MPKWELFRKLPFWRFKLSTLCRQLEGDGGVPAGCGRTHLPLPAPDTAGGCRRPSPSLRHTDVSHPPAGTSIARPGIPAGAMQADGQWPSLRRDLRFRVGAGVLDGPFLPLAEASAPGGQGRQTLQSRTKQQADGRSPSACCLKWKQRDIIIMLPAHNSECRIPNS